MKFILEINTDSPIFKELGETKEVARILMELAENLPKHGEQEYFLSDLHGNNVGIAKFDKGQRTCFLRGLTKKKRPGAK